MLNFKEFLVEEGARVHKHSVHIEDLMFVGGKNGMTKAINALKDVKNCFGSSDVNDNRILSTKIDGSPALIVFWIGDKFGVASKSIFNKNPKVNFTEEDIKANHGNSEGLAQKLRYALKYLKNVVPRGKIYQGDFLYDETDRKSEKIDGVDCWTWHPNTIKYAVEKDSDLGRTIGKSKMGIVFHTEYTISNDDISTITLKGFNVTVDSFIPSSNVWVTDAFQKSIGSIPHFTESEEKVFNGTIKNINSLSSRIPWDYCAEHNVLLMSFCNSYITNGREYPSSKQMFNEYVEWLNIKKTKEVDSKKSEKGKEKALEKWKSVCEVPNTLVNAFEVYRLIGWLKVEFFIKKVNKIKSTKTFLKKSDGTLEVTDDEGYVLTRTDANGCKLVDRLEFAHANFSKDILKGWEH